MVKMPLNIKKKRPFNSHKIFC